MGQECTLPPPDKETCSKAGDPPGTCSSPKAGNPVYIGSGTKVESATDYADPHGLTFTRTYRSNRVASGPTGFAGGTFSNFHLRLVGNTTSDRLYAFREDGSVQVFNVAGGTIQSDADIADRITALLDGSGNANGWSYYRASNEDIETYDVQGRLISILHRDGQLIRLSYANASGGVYPDGAPACSTSLPTYGVNGTAAPWCVTDPYGRQLNFAYDDQARLVSVVDPSGQAITYEYNGVSAPYPNVAGSTLALLTKVTYPDSTSRTYYYDEPANSASSTHGLLTGISDENGVRYATFRYDANGNAIDTFHANHIDRFQIANPGTSSVSVTDPLGSTLSYGFTSLLGTQRSTTTTRPLGSGTATQTLGYDANGNVASKVDFDGHTTTYQFDLTRNLEVHRIASLGETSQRTIDTTWHPTFRVPTDRRILNASNTLESRTTWAYNTRGQATARCQIDPADAVAMAYTCSATTAPAATAKVRRSVTTYCEQADITAGTCPLVGLVTSVNGPRASSDAGMGGVDDLTTYTYYQTDDATCASGGACAHRHGDLWKIANALGQITEYVSYDKSGRVTRMKDANGTYTDLAYHPRGWLTDRIVRASATGAAGAGDATTHIDYDAVGNVKKVTQPDGAYLAYTYDDAHRLIKIADNQNNTIDYCPGGVGSATCLDAAGNRLVEQVKDPSGTLKRSLKRSYNQLSQLIQVSNAASQPVEHSNGLTDTGVADGYDGNGNRVLVQDGFNTTTRQTYDGLNRLVATIQNAGGSDPATANTTTGYTYDSRDNLRQVTDPDGLNTVYDYDGLDNLTGLHSPDTGFTSYASDKAGNRISQTDNRGITSTYTYDALNRLTGIGYPTTSLNVTYAYDQANATTGCTTSYPLGRLTRMTDSSGSTTYCYDRRGNVTQKKQVTGATTLTMQYSYTVADRLASLTYPSGAIVTYGRDNVGRITSVTWKANATASATTIVSNASYYPFGPLNVLTWGNGRTLTKTYDQDYAIDQIVSSAASGLKLDLGVDVMGDITSASGSIGPATPDRKYQYDPLYRLTTAQTGATPPGPLELYTYGKTGDRLSASLNGAATQPYTYTPATHHLASVNGTSRSYDNNGNTTNTGAAMFTYDDRNRMSAATKGTTTAAYLINGRGERVSKQVSVGGLGTGPQAFVYDEGGQLLSDGVTLTEFVYLDSMPIAAIKSGTISYIETDHLGTPRQVVDSATNLAKWTWSNLGGVFGTDASNQAPNGGAVYAMNLRFPGQYYDAETGLVHNGWREYDKDSGRYMQSDPIGLRGGVNTYAYVDSNPLRFFDPRGREQWQGCPDGSVAPYGTCPPAPPPPYIPQPPGPGVYICCRPAQIAGGLINHCWVKTSTSSAGMGANPDVPPGQEYEGYGMPVQVIDHSKDTPTTCQKMNNVNESCVDSQLKIGRPLGRFLPPANQCQSFAYGVINNCRTGPQCGDGCGNQ